MQMAFPALVAPKTPESVLNLSDLVDGRRLYTFHQAGRRNQS
jgi:hypothetical protein